MVVSANFSCVYLQGDWKLSNKADPNGLVSGHAYTITGIEKVR